MCRRLSVCRAETRLGAFLPCPSAARRWDRRALDGLRMKWDREKEGGSSSWLGFDPDSSPIALHHPFANRQADTGAAILRVVRKPLEYAEDFLPVLGINPDPVVFHGKAPHLAYLSGGEVDSGWLIGPVFHRV